ncbi:ABC transporter permease [Leucobacter sp. UT-8R-CII-1-4]|uniref:ABC transporter permease n=1 Tax=Leucobacter sp. UT-8R-CII-1-4 TaxID=3040075 RepID=UPI0024A9AFB9|nr:ABC transporter permease [Leucobacter sp. UT-8R-CII-1-4]MDI6022732.1 ABC transporter permease [Leucobacter sp. UT-8R-CII-1-4]
MIFEQIVEFFSNPANWSGPDGIPVRLGEHLLYTFVVVLIGIAIAIPVGAIIGHTRRGAWLVINIANGSRALPTLGLLTLMVLLLGLGFLPAAIVLVILAIPPMLTATYAGVRGVDPAVVDAARGIGMPEWRILLTVELPIATRVIVSGIRSSVLQVIATATIAAYIALGGLGRFLLDGLALRDYGEMAGGALLVASLALVTDGLFALGGIRRKKAPVKAADTVAAKAKPAEVTETRVVRLSDQT